MYIFLYKKLSFRNEVNLISGCEMPQTSYVYIQAANSVNV